MQFPSIDKVPWKPADFQHHHHRNHHPHCNHHLPVQDQIFSAMHRCNMQFACSAMHNVMKYAVHNVTRNAATRLRDLQLSLASAVSELPLVCFSRAAATQLNTNDPSEPKLMVGGQRTVPRGAPWSIAQTQPSCISRFFSYKAEEHRWYNSLQPILL